jgi:hypothetical protein
VDRLDAGRTRIGTPCHTRNQRLVQELRQLLLYPPARPKGIHPTCLIDLTGALVLFHRVICNIQ